MQVTITNENLIPVLGDLERAAIADLDTFLAGASNEQIARVGLARQLLRIRDQILSSVDGPNGAIVQQILKLCPPCPCGSEESVLAGVVYRLVDGEKVEGKTDDPKKGGDRR